MNQGTIALDIDGTITNREHRIPDGVANYFKQLYDKGWAFVFATGRSMSFAMKVLPKLTFPYLLALQNGADLLEMPSGKTVERFYMKTDVIEHLDRLYEEKQENFIVYSGCEKGDKCYFQPGRFSERMQRYLKELEALSAAPWTSLESSAISQQNSFPLVKCFGPKEMLENLNRTLCRIEGLQTALIKDKDVPSFDLHLILVTHKDADKGIAVNYFMEKYRLKRPLITGGDDNNDIPLLKCGDIRIAMDGAPVALRNIAEIIAPSADRMGIIQGIEEAIKAPFLS